MDFSKELSKFEIDSKEYNFFKKVFEKLEPDCVRKSVREKQKEVHTKLCEVQQEYFQERLLNDAIIKSAGEMKCQKADTEASSFVSSLYLNMAKRSLPPEESQKLKLFGLSKDKVPNLSERQEFKSKYAVFKKSIEDNINDICKQLITYTGGMTLPGEDWQNAFDRTMKELECKVIVSTQEMKEQPNKKRLREMIKTYYEELTKGVSLLTKALLLTEDRLKFEFDFSEMYHLRCHAVSLKLKCCELKILQHTYDEETLPALKKISSHLNETEKKLNEDLYEKTDKLESYLKLGQDYAHLVDKYTDLMKSIKEQKWATDELKARLAQPGPSSSN